MKVDKIYEKLGIFLYLGGVVLLIYNIKTNRVS